MVKQQQRRRRKLWPCSSLGLGAPSTGPQVPSLVNPHISYAPGYVHVCLEVLYVFFIIFIAAKLWNFISQVFALLGCWSICPPVHLSIVCCSNIKSDWLKKSHVHTSDISIWISLSKTIILIFWVCVSKPKGELHVCQVPNFEKLFKSLSYLHVFSKVKPLFYISRKIHLPF